MKLSVVIVNYNVKFFLEQCLNSVKAAVEGIDADVWVVDNDSKDGSVEMIEEKYDWVKLIANKDNVGFSKANNQAVRQSNAEYVLLLNPDTVVEEDTFKKIIEFMDENPNAGGLGVKMIDGKGEFLPESKRGLPTPSVAFYKIFGLSSLFPKSKLFGKYHLTFLDKDKIHKIDVLSGAFMMMRMSVLDKVGLLDEDYFMYGEDIDLSYRITQAGYDNYYYPDTKIIHYKGESTKKGSLNYVFIFYRAMIIFAKKHFSSGNARMFSFFINLAIYFRAFLSIANRVINKLWMPFGYFLIMFLGFIAIQKIYENYSGIPYNNMLTRNLTLMFSLAYVLNGFLFGIYNRVTKIKSIFKSSIFALIIILVCYSLLPENYRFSRAIVLIGGAWSLISFTMLRLGLMIFTRSYKIGEKTKRIAIVGDTDEAKRVEDLISHSGKEFEVVGFINHLEGEPKDEYIGSVSNLKALMNLYKLDEIIFCAKNISSNDIITMMSNFDGENIEFKIAPSKSLFIIGSNSLNTQGELYTINIESISHEKNKSKKRSFDVISAIVMMILSPILIFFVTNKKKYFANAYEVLIGNKTWVGYVPNNGQEELPKLKKGVLTPISYIANSSSINIHKVNKIYSSDYTIYNDLMILYKSFGRL